MKKLLLVAALFVIQLQVSAQDLAGKYQVGGGFSVGFSEGNQESNSSSTAYNNQDNTWSFSIRPSVGYFINEKIALGGSFRYRYSNTKFEGNSSRAGDFDGRRSANSIGIGAFLRYHIPVSNQFLFFLQSDASFDKFGEKSEDIEGEMFLARDNFNARVGATPGVLFFLSDKVAIETSFGFFGYNYRLWEIPQNGNNDNYSKSSNNSFGFSLNPENVHFGIQFYL
jgi:hypothetical protein